MPYSIKSNNCEGWHQPVYRDPDGKEHRGARWPSHQEAYNAVIFHHKNGVFPSEVEEKEVNLCPHCDQPLPVDKP